MAYMRNRELLFHLTISDKLNKDISLVRGDEIRHGAAIDIDCNGALLVRFPDGSSEAVNSGEVSVRGMYGYV